MMETDPLHDPIEAAKADGYDAGFEEGNRKGSRDALEAAARWHEGEYATWRGTIRGGVHRESAAAIRSLADKSRPTEEVTVKVEGE